MKGRICLAGDFTFDRLGASWARAFESNGVLVARFDIPAEQARHLGWIARNRIGHRLSMRSYGLRHWAAREYNAALYDRVAGANVDALILHNAEFVFPDTVTRIRKLGVKVLAFHADNPFPPFYNNRPETLPTAWECSSYLTWSERLVDKLLRSGIRDARFLTFAWDPEVFPYEVPPVEQWRGVGFIGGWDKEREDFLEQVARQFPLKIFGPAYWGSRSRRRSLVRQCWMGTALLGADAARATRECAVNLNILRTQHYIDGQADGVIMRHFEVPGAGGFLLSTRSGGATRLFPEGETAAYFEGVKECLEKIAHYLGEPAQRRAVAARAHAEVARSHRYEHRVSEILRILDETN